MSQLPIFILKKVRKVADKKSEGSKVDPNFRDLNLAQCRRGSLGAEAQWAPNDVTRLSSFSSDSRAKTIQYSTEESLSFGLSHWLEEISFYALIG